MGEQKPRRRRTFLEGGKEGKRENHPQGRPGAAATRRLLGAGYPVTAPDVEREGKKERGGGCCFPAARGAVRGRRVPPSGERELPPSLRRGESAPGRGSGGCRGAGPTCPAVPGTSKGPSAATAPPLPSRCRSRVCLVAAAAALPRAKMAAGRTAHARAPRGTPGIVVPATTLRQRGDERSGWQDGAG